MKKTLIIFSAIVVLASVSSCNRMLDITPPSSITDEQVMDIYENGTDAQKEAIVKGIVGSMPKYFNLNDNDYGCSTGGANTMRYSYVGIEWGRALMGADIVSGYNLEANDLAGKQVYRYNEDFRGPSASTNYCYWAMYAAGINQANIALGWVTEEKAKEGALYKDGRARALLVRAYCYMCMMEEYQDAYLKGGKEKLGLPHYTNYDPLQETVARAETAEATWNFIKKDMTDAIKYLTDAGTGYTAGRDLSEDLDLGVANFLYARACLLTGDWANCIKACDAIIGSEAYSFIDAENWGGHNTGEWTPTDQIKVLPQTNAFASMACNPETILGFKKNSGFYGSAADHFNLANVFGNYSQQGNVTRIDKTLYDKIPADDIRKEAFYPNEIGDYKFSNKSTGKLPSYVNLKFSATEGLADSGVASSGKPEECTKLDYTKFRLAEVYLMKAEAECMSGSEDAAKATLYALLAERLSTTFDPSKDDTWQKYGQTLLDAVKLNWHIEMWGEGGREWYNAKRWGEDIKRESQMHTDAGSLISSWPANKMTLHIPSRELQTNNKCVDNTINE